MKKKATGKLKRSSVKLHKRQRLTSNLSVPIKNAPKLAPRTSLADDPNFAQAVQNYEAGLKALQQRKFERAKALLEKVVAGNSRELADRAAVHLNTCQQQLSRSVAGGFKSPEEHYDYAISLMNSGDYDNARLHLEKLQKQEPRADYVWYGLSVLDCLTNHYEGALKNLEEAIRRNSANRYQARNEPDFQNLADDPRFTELLYPEGTSDALAPPLAENGSNPSFKRR